VIARLTPAGQPFNGIGMAGHLPAMHVDEIQWVTHG
jgi:hypothetical protein